MFKYEFIMLDVVTYNNEITRGIALQSNCIEMKRDSGNNSSSIHRA
jgi:hypothetical protein